MCGTCTRICISVPVDLANFFSKSGQRILCKCLVVSHFSNWPCANIGEWNATSTPCTVVVVVVVVNVWYFKFPLATYRHLLVVVVMSMCGTCTCTYTCVPVDLVVILVLVLVLILVFARWVRDGIGVGIYIFTKSMCGTLTCICISVPVDLAKFFSKSGQSYLCNLLLVSKFWMGLGRYIVHVYTI